MADILCVIECSKCHKINMYKKTSIDDVIMQCWYCDQLQVVQETTSIISLDAFNAVIAKKIAYEGIKPK